MHLFGVSFIVSLVGILRLIYGECLPLFLFFETSTLVSTHESLAHPAALVCFIILYYQHGRTGMAYSTTNYYIQNTMIVQASFLD